MSSAAVSPSKASRSAEATIAPPTVTAAAALVAPVFGVAAVVRATAEARIRAGGEGRLVDD